MTRKQKLWWTENDGLGVRLIVDGQTRPKIYRADAHAVDAMRTLLHQKRLPKGTAWDVVPVVATGVVRAARPEVIEAARRHRAMARVAAVAGLAE
jgi:hypothetical protein